MLLYLIATFCIVSATGYSIVDEDYNVFESDPNELYWAEEYTVKATRASLTSNLLEDYTAWKTNQSSRVDYNQGAVKIISLVTSDSEDRYLTRHEIHPETTEEVLNEIVCHTRRRTYYDYMRLNDILPPISEDEVYELVGNETVDGKETVKFEYNQLTREQDVRNTIWAYYTEDMGWIPVRYEKKEYNVVFGSLSSHSIWTFFEFNLDVPQEAFDVAQYGCNETAEEFPSESEKITKELLFIDPEDDEHVDYIFNHFKNKYERKYAHDYEHAFRKAIFRENMRTISSVNRRNLTYKLGINKFSDWTVEELKRGFGAIPRPEGLVGNVAFPYDESKLDEISDDLPKEYDMRLLGYISPVKNQETCGSCWTFAAAAATESALARINGGKVLALSNQAIVDCAYEGLAEMGGGGCKGGFDTSAYEFIMKHGLPTEQEYGPYKNRDGYCKIGNMTKTYPITGFTDVTKNNFNAMKVALVNNGPLFVAIDVSFKFASYSSGIFYDTNEYCDPIHPCHAVVVVGYGERFGELFWIVKNSWGTGWGDDGYIYMAARDNVCGVASRPTYPVF